MNNRVAIDAGEVVNVSANKKHKRELRKPLNNLKQKNFF